MIRVVRRFCRDLLEVALVLLTGELILASGALNSFLDVGLCLRNLDLLGLPPVIVVKTLLAKRMGTATILEDNEMTLRTALCTSCSHLRKHGYLLLGEHLWTLRNVLWAGLTFMPLHATATAEALLALGTFDVWIARCSRRDQSHSDRCATSWTLPLIGTRPPFLECATGVLHLQLLR
jgi:hypothetical protein